MPRILIALAYGALCHGLFLAGITSMIVMMGFGMSQGFGQVPWPWALVVNALLVLQFPIGHSLLLTRNGRSLLMRLAPAAHGKTLATTTYVIIASVQLLILFLGWTPSGIVWFRAEGAVLALTLGLYGASWLLLGKAILDGGPALQSGFLGWSALLRNVKPRFPDMPTTGLFRLVRQPIYVAFALTLWTVPVWTPDQLALAIVWTGYCVLAPKLKEQRFAAMFGGRFERYRAQVPYWIPRLRPREIADV